MNHFQLIAEGLDVSAAIAQIDGQPELWNARASRRAASDSPHRETNDLWLRYRRPEEMMRPDHMREPHTSIWYPAIKALPAVYALVEGLFLTAKPYLLGGVLVTRIPPGCQVYSHSDRGAWHADYYDLKVWTILRGNDRCVNVCDDESLVMKPGEAWSYDNAKPHAVMNDGDTERVCLISCFRRTP